jgi:hypothetical protein
MGTGMSYIPLPQEKENTKDKVLVTDQTVKELLGAILIELKRMNVQFEILTETIVEEGDV